MATVFGTAGDDTIKGEPGVDAIFAGAGDDLCDAMGQRLAIFGEDGNDTIGGSTSGCVLDGGAGNDHIEATEGRQTMLGGAGDDWLIDYRPYTEADRMAGGTGADRIWGGGGADSIVGGAGADELRGGGSADKFIFQKPADSTVWHRDTIGDWQNGLDILHLRYLDADQTTAGDQAFTFIGTAAFTGAIGELRYEHVDGNTIVSAQVDADAAIDFQIRITGIHDLSAAIIWL